MSNQLTCSSDDEQRCVGGIHRVQKRRVHNEVERRRKDKINSWILKIGELLPDKDSKRQSKHGILEKAVKYINYLRETNENLLLDKCTEVQVAEMRQMKNQVLELQEQNSSYIKLLNAASIPLNSTPEEIWSQQPGKYSNKLTSEQASALIDHFEKKKKLNGLLKLNTKEKSSGNENNSVSTKIAKNGFLNNSSSASDVDTMIPALDSENTNVEYVGDISSSTTSNELGAEDAHQVTTGITSLFSGSETSTSAKTTGSISCVGTLVKNRVEVTQSQTPNTILCDTNKQSLCSTGVASTIINQSATVSSVSVLPLQVSLATSHVSEMKKPVDSCNVQLATQQQVIVVNGKNIPLLQKNVPGHSVQSSSFTMAPHPDAYELQVRQQIGLAASCTIDETAYNETFPQQVSSETLTLPVPTTSVISTSVLGNCVPSVTFSPSFASSCNEIRPPNNSSLICPSQVHFSSSLMNSQQIPVSCVNGYMSGFNSTLPTLQSSLQQVSQTGHVQTPTEVSAQNTPYPCGLLNQSVVQPGGFFGGQHLILNQQGQVISISGNPLLTTAGGVQPQAMLPSALILPNGQIIPVVSQPSVVYAGPPGGVNGNIMLTPSGATTNMPIAPVVSTGLSTDASACSMVANNMLCAISGSLANNDMNQQSMLPVTHGQCFSGSSVTGPVPQKLLGKNTYPISLSKNGRAKETCNTTVESMPQKTVSAKSQSGKSKKTVTVTGDKDPVFKVQNSKCSTVGTSKASKNSQRAIRPKPTLRQEYSPACSSSHTVSSGAKPQVMPLFSGSGVSLSHETATVSSSSSVLLDTICLDGSLDSSVISTNNHSQSQPSCNGDRVSECITEEINSTSSSESQPLLSCSDLSASQPHNTTTDILAKATESIFSNCIEELSSDIQDFGETSSLNDATEQTTSQCEENNENANVKCSSRNSPEEQSYPSENKCSIQESSRTKQLSTQGADMFSSLNKNILEHDAADSKNNSSEEAQNVLETKETKNIQNATNENGKRTFNEIPGNAEICSSNQNTPPAKKSRSETELGTEKTDIQSNNAEVNESNNVQVFEHPLEQLPTNNKHLEEITLQKTPETVASNTQKQQNVHVNSSLACTKNTSVTETSLINNEIAVSTSFCSVPEVRSYAVPELTEIRCASNHDNSSELPALLLGNITEDSDAPSSLNSGSDPNLPFLTLSPSEHFSLDLHGKETSNNNHNMFNLHVLSASYQNSRNSSEKNNHVTSSKMVNEISNKQNTVSESFSVIPNNFNNLQTLSSTVECSLPKEHFNTANNLNSNSSTNVTYYQSTDQKYVSKTASSNSFVTNGKVSKENSVSNIFTGSSNLSVSSPNNISVPQLPEMSCHESNPPPLLSRVFVSKDKSQNSVETLESPSSLSSPGFSSQTPPAANQSSKDQNIQSKILSPCKPDTPCTQKPQNSSSRLRQRPDSVLNGSKFSSLKASKVSSISKIVPSPDTHSLIPVPLTAAMSNDSFTSESATLQGNPSLSCYSAESLIGSALPVVSSSVIPATSGSSFTTLSFSRAHSLSSHIPVQCTPSEQCITRTLSYSAESLIHSQAPNNKRRDNRQRSLRQVSHSGQMNNNHIFQNTQQHAFKKSFLSSLSQGNSSNFSFNSPSEIHHECTPFLQVSSQSSQSSSPRAASNFTFQRNSSATNAQSNSVSNDMAQQEMQNCSFGSNTHSFVSQHACSLSSQLSSNPSFQSGGSCPPPVTPQPYSDFSISLGNSENNIVGNPVYHRSVTNATNFNTPFSTCLQNLQGNNLTSNSSFQNQRENFLPNANVPSGHTGPFFQMPDPNFAVLTNSSSLSDHPHSGTNLGITSFLGNCPQSTQSHLSNNFFPGHFIPGISDQKSETSIQRVTHGISFLDEMNKQAPKESRISSQSRTPGPGQNKQNTSKNKGSRKAKQQVSVEHPSLHTLPVFDGNHNTNVLPYLQAPELSAAKHDTIPYAGSRCIGISKKSNSPASSHLPRHSLKNDHSGQNSKTDIGNANHFFRSHSQNSLNLNFQSARFGMNAFHQLPVTSSTNIRSSNTVGSQNSNLCNHHVSNFNLSNIIPDINNSSADSVGFSPIKFNASVYIPPLSAQAQVQSSNDTNGIGHSGPYQNNHAPPPLYHGRTHPSVIHNSMSFNTFLGHNPHSFDGRPPVQMSVGMNSNVAPPTPFPPAHGHPPSFGNMIPTLNFSMHDQL